MDKDAPSPVSPGSQIKSLQLGQEPIVFLGPSLARTDAERLCAAHYRGPAARGDILRLLATGHRGPIVVVDGVRHGLALSPKEILRALDAGVACYGAAALGALRAVELAAFGMRGVGRIFELFRSGELEGDDEIARACDPAGAPVSEALVDVRLAARAAASVGIFDATQAAQVEDVASRIYYVDRTLQNLLLHLHPVLGPVQSEAFARTLMTNRRTTATDTELLLRELPAL